MKRTAWTDELIVDALRPHVNEHGQLPTVNFLRSIGRNDIACAMTKRGGWKRFAALLNTTLTPSDTVTGWNAEIAAGDWLRSLGYEAEQQTARCHFDILVNGVLRIDVKGAKFARYGASAGWFYRMGKVITADVVLCARMDRGDFYVFPWFRVPATNLTISESGGWRSQYLMNTDVLQQMLKSRTAELEAFPAKQSA
jgi:hypothetical protein